MSSIQRSGCFLAFANPVDAFLRQYQQYLKSFIWLWINFVVNGWQEVKQIAPLSLIIRRYCFHRSSNGMIASHRQFVIPYGRSHKIMSILLSGYIDIPEIQSMLKIRLIYSNCLINVTCLSFLKKTDSTHLKVLSVLARRPFRGFRRHRESNPVARAFTHHTHHYAISA